MKERWFVPILAMIVSWFSYHPALGDDKPAVAFPRFRMQEIETGLTVGYGVLLVDINGDGKPDIVVADSRRVVWYENPTWKRHTIIEGLTKPDNVCIAAYDIDGDGQLDLALGADWKGANPQAEGTIQWLKRGKTLDEPWSVHPIGAEPTVHRMRFVDIDGTGKPALIVAPLVGRNSTAKNNWMDGPVRILAYRIPKDPIHDRWVPEVLDESLHVVHNLWPFGVGGDLGKGTGLLCASYEGVTQLRPRVSGPESVRRRRFGVGNQANPRSNRGSSEVKNGELLSSTDSTYFASIEPWHGNQVVVYTSPKNTTEEEAWGKPWNRQVIDDQLKWGHAVWCADLDGDFNEEIIIGIRDNLANEPGKRCGVRIYKAVDKDGTKWARQIIDDGGVAVEDLAAADLNGDKRIDIVAVGRQTHNIRIYWNEGVKKGGPTPR